MYDIKRLNSPNYEPRVGFKPIMIVNHITDGQEAVRSSDDNEENAVQNTFMSPNSSASSHFEIERDGRIKQYVDILNAAWTQGLHSSDQLALSTSTIVKQMNTNPNLYCVSKEYNAYSGHGGFGDITEAQFWAGLWLDKWIQQEVKRLFGNTLLLNSSFVIGHNQIDPVNRPFDPGPQFPWEHYYSEYGIIQNISLDEVEQRIKKMTSVNRRVENCFAVWNEVDYLYGVLKSPDSADSAKWALGIIIPIFADQGVLQDVYSTTANYDQFHNDVRYIYDSSSGKNGGDAVGWAENLLNLVYPVMKAKGLA